MKINDDAGYQKALEWLVERSKMIANPLIKETVKMEHRRLYDIVETEIRAYSHKVTFGEPEKQQSALDAWLD